MRAGGTRRDDRVVRPHQAVFDRDLTRDQVDQPTVNEMGADAARPLFVEHDRFAFDPRQAADPRADRTARAEAFLTVQENVEAPLLQHSSLSLPIAADIARPKIRPAGMPPGARALKPFAISSRVRKRTR